MWINDCYFSVKTFIMNVLYVAVVKIFCYSNTDLVGTPGMDARETFRLLFEKLQGNV